VDIRVGCHFGYLAEVPTAVVVQVEPRFGSGPNLVRQGWANNPPLELRPYRDGFGNPCRRGVLPPGPSILSYDATVTVSDRTDEVDTAALEVPPDLLPDEALVFTLPSRFCLPDQLADVAWSTFGGRKPGYNRVQEICDFVHDWIRFDYTASSPLASALDAYATRAGVCRDFAHLGITLCRALNIPARYAFGYIPDIGVPAVDSPMDFCAWMEVFLGGRWWTFDPRNNTPRAGRVLVGRGRDAVDVAMITAFGGPTLTSMTVWAEPAAPTD
jgi:transglutaminase-like putative cysteine protease